MTWADIPCYFSCIIRNQYKVNSQINASELRVVDEDGKSIGVLDRDKALQAAEERGLDLVLINQQTVPPIAKIISFDKFRYQEEKEQKKLRTHKGGELKQVRITVRAAENDLRRQAQKAGEFLEEGNKVEIMLALRGREKSAAMKNWVYDRLNLFLSMITVEYKITSEPHAGGRGIVTQIIKK